MMEVLIDKTVWLLLATLGRSFFGWLENAVEDGKITVPELKQLFTTFFRMGAPYLSLWLGFDILPLQAAFMSIIFDVIFLKVVKIVKQLDKK